MWYYTNIRDMSSFSQSQPCPLKRKAPAASPSGPLRAYQRVRTFSWNLSPRSQTENLQVVTTWMRISKTHWLIDLHNSSYLTYSIRGAFWDNFFPYRLPWRQNPLEWPLMDLTAACLSGWVLSKLGFRNFLRWQYNCSLGKKTSWWFWWCKNSLAACVLSGWTFAFHCLPTLSYTTCQRRPKFLIFSQYKSKSQN